MKYKMYMPIALMAVLFFFNTVTGFGQRQYRLTGKVMDSINNNFPIAGATLTIRSTGKSATTDAKGAFSFVVTDADLEYQLILSLPNGTDIPYRLQKKEFWSSTYKIYRIDFFLQEMIKTRPDTDGDKVPDDIDKCPAVPGIAKYNGCPIPDTDKDGINDENDKCPTVPGTKDNYGCPVISNPNIGKANWNFRTAKTMNKSSEWSAERQLSLNEVMKKEFSTTHIIPTKEAEKLIRAINPKLKDGRKINYGEEIILPNFPETGFRREQELQAEFEKDMRTDERGLTEFLKVSSVYNNILEVYPLPDHFQKLKAGLNNTNVLLQRTVNGPHKNLRKFETDMLNNEITDFNLYYLKLMSAGNIKKTDTAYLYSFNQTIHKILSPLYSKMKKGGLKESRKLSGPSAPGFEWEETAFDEPESLLGINLYVFTPDILAPPNSYWIYCLSPRQHQRLTNKEITFDDLARMNALVPYPASVTAKLINPSFTWYFIAVPKNGVKKIVATTRVSGDEIPEHSLKPEMIELYAVPLYIEN